MTPSLEYFHRVNGASGLLDRLLYTDIKTYLVELLMKQDQMSMSMSIESRVPFLDHVLVEFAARLPASHEAERLHDQAHPARSGQGHRSRRDPDAAEDGVSRSVRRVGAGTAGTRGPGGPHRSTHARARPDRHRRGRRDCWTTIGTVDAPVATRSGRCSTSSSGIARSSTATGFRLFPRRGPHHPGGIARARGVRPPTRSSETHEGVRLRSWIRR